MKIKIQKFDPSVDLEPYYIEHEIEHTGMMSVLEAITVVHEQCEAVSFDYSCHGRMCGRCSVMMDGMPVLACSTPITDKDHVIEPLKGMPIVRDLVVDKSDLDNELSRVYLRIRTEPVKLEEMSDFNVEDKDVIYALSNCLRCGMCNAACPAVSIVKNKYAGPAFMVANGFRYYDPYDQADRVLEAVSNGMYHCTMCGTCDSVCPRNDIDHQDLYKVLRAEAEKRGLKPSYAD